MAVVFQTATAFLVLRGNDDVKQSCIIIAIRFLQFVLCGMLAVRGKGNLNRLRIDLRPWYVDDAGIYGISIAGVMEEGVDEQ